jgi:hypothetical protein
MDILTDGVSTAKVSGGFTALTSFSITGHFIDSINTLEFLVGNAFHNGRNVSNPTAEVPEPTTLALVGAALRRCVGST